MSPPEPVPPVPPDEGSRISRVETLIGALAGDIAATQDQVRGLALDLRNSIDSIRSSVEERSRTPWSTIAAWAAVTISIGTGIVLVGTRELEGIRDRVVPIERLIVEELPKSAAEHARTAETIRWLEKLEDERRGRENRELAPTPARTPR